MRCNTGNKLIVKILGEQKFCFLNKSVFLKPVVLLPAAGPQNNFKIIEKQFFLQNLRNRKNENLYKKIIKL